MPLQRTFGVPVQVLELSLFLIACCRCMPGLPQVVLTWLQGMHRWAIFRATAFHPSSCLRSAKERFRPLLTQLFLVSRPTLLTQSNLIIFYCLELVLINLVKFLQLFVAMHLERKHLELNYIWDLCGIQCKPKRVFCFTDLLNSSILVFCISCIPKTIVLIQFYHDFYNIFNETYVP